MGEAAEGAANLNFAENRHTGHTVSCDIIMQKNRNQSCTTAYRGFAESLRRSAKAVLLSAKRSLSRVIHRALGKGFAESQT